MNTQLQFEFRTPSDLDVMVPPGWGHSQGDIFWDDRLRQYRDDYWWLQDVCMPLDELYTMKVSHQYWELPNGSWNKHMYDIVEMKRAGAKLIQRFHDILYPIWEDLHGSKKMMFKGKDDFFEDAVVRKYDHDSIHDSVAYGDEAMYIQTLKRPGHTAVDMDYIKGMTYEAQVLLYREEVAATALERIVIPRNYVGSPGAAWTWALRRTITSLTKGWSAQFIVENYEDFARPDDYVGRHLANKERLILL